MITRDLGASDIVYDQNENVIYATVSSAAGLPYGNSLVTLDPDTLDVLDHVFVGSEPNKLAVSNDGSRVYIGIDGATAFRYLEPATGKLGPLRQLTGRGSVHTPGDPAVAEDMIVSPIDPRVVIVSSDALGSSSGHVEVFNDADKLQQPAMFDQNSLAIVDNGTVFGFQNAIATYRSTRFGFDGSVLTTEQSRLGVISGRLATIEASGGLVFSTGGEVVDPMDLTLIGQFSNVFGEIEPSVRDGLIYFMRNETLSVFDTNSFQELDSRTLNVTDSNLGTLDFAGSGRLAFVKADGHIGVISGVALSAPPLPVFKMMGTSGDDNLVFDLANRTATLNGTTFPVAAEVRTFRFSGKGGQDNVVYIGDQGEQEFAVLKSDLFSVESAIFRFVARDFNRARFVADSEDDIAAFYDSVDDDELSVTPSRVLLENSLVQLVGTDVATTYVVSNAGGNDQARFHGVDESIGLNANAGARRIRFGNSNFVVNATGFNNAYMNGGGGIDDIAMVVDSTGDDVFYANGNYGRLSNDVGVVYAFKEFEKLNVRSHAGEDIGILQQSNGSSVEGNSTRTSLMGPGFRTNLIDFSNVIVNE